MDLEKKVLACVDQSHFADYVVDYSVWAAQRLAAPLELLHVLERHPEIAAHADHSGTLGLDAQAQLLTTLTEEDESRSKSAGNRGGASSRGSGAEPFMRAWNTRTCGSAMARWRTRWRSRNGTRGFSCSGAGEKRRNIRSVILAEASSGVVRRLKRPILAVTEDFNRRSAPSSPSTAAQMTRRGVDLIAKSPLLTGLPMDILVSGKGKGEGLRHLPWAQKTLEQAGYAVEALQIPGDPERVIAETVQTREADLLIMGAYGHSPLRSLIFGSKTSDLLRSATLPTLLLR